jgi:hypothetical protein
MIAMKPIAIATIACALLGCTATATAQVRVAKGAEAVKAASDADAASGLPIRSRAQLDAWLRSHAGAPTPLDRMPAGARARFLASLRFGSKGLRGFGTEDLGATLASAEIRAVLALFGPKVEELARHIASTRPPGAMPATTQAMSDIERRFNEIYFLDLELAGAEDAERAKRLASRYRALFPQARDPAWLHAASDADLKLLYRAATRANFYGADSDAATAMAATIEELDARAIATSAELQDSRDALLAARQFDAAHRFETAHATAGLAPLPDFHGISADFGGNPSLWHLEPGANVLARYPVDTGPLQVMVLAGCHFAADAARDIVADPLLGPLFRTHAHWLSLPPGQEDLQALRDWNREHPQAPLEMLYDRSEWPMFTRWTMPTFYVVRDGKVLGSMAGWSSSSRAELVALLRRTGLLL